MYSHHLGLSQEPFSIAPDPRFMFMSERHREALAHLLYGVSGGSGSAASGGFVLLTGEIGAGKTTVCRCFLEQIPAHSHVAYIFNPKLSVIELLQSICDEFHIALPASDTTAPSAKTCIDALNGFLLERHGAGQRCVLIIDEAQNLEPAVLEQLRLLTNLETNERKLLQIVLIGQPELRTMLAQPEMEQLAQRVIARFHLQALSPEETSQYIAHRLAVAGHEGGALFDARALARIHRLSQGVPRRINLLCDRALLGAWANGVARVNTQIIDQAAGEVFGQTPAFDKWQHRWTLGLLALVFVMVVSAGSWWAWQTLNLATTPRLPTQAPLASGPSKTPLEAPLPKPSTDLKALMALPASDMNTAWQALASVWQHPVSASEPCESPEMKPWQCYRASKLSLVQLRQLDRPGIISLHHGAGEPVQAILLGLNAHSALLQVNGVRYKMGQVALAQLWRGDFATLWQAPEGYAPDLRDGARGPAIEALSEGLAKLDGYTLAATQSAATTLDAALRERVRNFQRTLGLTPDGQPGPLTFMQLARATDAKRVRLQSDFE